MSNGCIINCIMSGCLQIAQYIKRIVNIRKIYEQHVVKLNKTVKMHIFQYIWLHKYMINIHKNEWMDQIVYTHDICKCAVISLAKALILHLDKKYNMKNHLSNSMLLYPKYNIPLPWIFVMITRCAIVIRRYTICIYTYTLYVYYQNYTHTCIYEEHLYAVCLV